MTCNAAIVGVSFDTPAENRAFAEAQAFPFPLLCDTTRSMGLAWGACASADARYPDRITCIVDEAGRIAWAEKVTDIAAHVQDAMTRLCAP